MLIFNAYYCYTILTLINDNKTRVYSKSLLLLTQGPREGWAEGALAPPLFGVIEKINK